MNNGQINTAFTNTLSDPILDQILKAGSKHYGCSEADFAEEVCAPEAELLPEYLTGSIRTTVNLFMKAWASKNITN